MYVILNNLLDVDYSRTLISGCPVVVVVFYVA